MQRKLQTCSLFIAKGQFYIIIIQHSILANDVLVRVIKEVGPHATHRIGCDCNASRTGFAVDVELAIDVIHASHVPA